MNISQTFSIAVQSLRNNKLRTGLTILGVVVGIFSIIVIMTIITMLQKSIEEGLSQLNKYTFQIQKMTQLLAADQDSEKQDQTLKSKKHTD